MVTIKHKYEEEEQLCTPNKHCLSRRRCSKSCSFPSLFRFFVTPASSLAIGLRSRTPQYIPISHVICISGAELISRPALQSKHSQFRQQQRPFLTSMFPFAIRHRVPAPTRTNYSASPQPYTLAIYPSTPPRSKFTSSSHAAATFGASLWVWISSRRRRAVSALSNTISDTMPKTRCDM